MSSRRWSAPLDVQVPPPDADRPSWTRVGVIAAIGFIIGIAWPRLAGVRLGPSVPEASSAAPVLAPSSSAEIPAASGETSALASVVPASAAPPAPPGPTVTVAVGHGTVLSCKTGDTTQKGSECGSLPGLDAAVTPRLKRLADCPDAASAEGKLRLLLRVDFARGTLEADSGRGSGGVSSPEALVTCARAQLAGTSLGGVSHDGSRYTVAYAVTFSSGRAESPAPAPAAAPARSGAEPSDATAQVQWDVAIVRDAPRTGKIVARLQRGTTLRVGSLKDGWYPVKYGDAFASDGWVYRAAIGR